MIVTLIILQNILNFCYVVMAMYQLFNKKGINGLYDMGEMFGNGLILMIIPTKVPREDLGGMEKIK